jgi:dipeptidyl aminopeptidase/acylaminoacyl peptidase
LFGAPERKGAALSPDGKWIGYLVAMEAGGYDLVAAAADDLVDVRKLARGVDDFAWVGSLALYRDAAGYHVADPQTPDPDTPRAVLAGPGNRVLAANPARSGRALLMVGQRGEVFELDLASGAQASVMLNREQFSEVLFNAQGRPAIAARNGEVWALTPRARKVLTLPGEAAPLLLSPTPNGASVYLNAAQTRDKRALLRVDLAGGAVTAVAENQNADIASALFAPDGAATAYASEGLRREWTALTPQARGDLETLGQTLKPGYRVLSRSADDGRWLVEEIAPQQSPRVFLYDRKAKTVDKVFSALPPLEERTLQPTRAIVIQGRGKYTLPAWLTLPLVADPDGDGKANASAPLVLLVGGAREPFAYDALTQMLANRGYAVLALTPRGGPGFGKAFAAAGAGDVGQALLADVADATRWAVAQKIAAPGKAAVIGEGDGGFAAVASLMFTPDEYACAVSVDGPMNLLTAPVGNVAAWSAALKSTDGQAKLKAISPWFHADQAKKPLLLVRRQANEQTKDFVAAIKTNKGPVAYALYRDGGDRFATVPERMSFAALSSAFLSKCLGGRADPIGPDFRGSSLQIVEGGALIPDLANALTPRDRDLAAPP